MGKGGKVRGPRPFFVSEFISIPELYVQNFVVIHAFVEEISAEKYKSDTTLLFFINRFCPFSIPNKPYLSCFQLTDRRTDIARSTQNRTRTQKIYTLWGLRRFLRHVTHGMTKSIYPPSFC